MLAELVAFGLLRANVCAGGVILAVLAVRSPVRRRLGGQAAYALWGAVPLAMIASVFPSLHLVSDGALSLGGAGGFRAPEAVTEGALLVWLAGVAVFVFRLHRADRRFRSAAAAGLAGPAVSGVLWPRIVTPSDYAQRFTAQERALICAHERAHIARGDPMANLILAAVQVLAWFNPLVHLGAARMRLDQEMACDEAVLAARPQERAEYARALLKAQITAQESGPAWAAFGSHPLEARVCALAEPSGRSPLVGLAIAALPLAAVLAAWALAPAAFHSASPMAGARTPALLIDLAPRGPR